MEKQDLMSILSRNIVKAAAWVELAIAVTVFVALLGSCLPVLEECLGLWHGGDTEMFHDFLGHALYLVIGIEFIEMLTKHSPGSALEVLMFAIVRHMLVDHGTSAENLLSVLAIAVLFAIRRFAFVPHFDGHEQETASEAAPSLDAALAGAGRRLEKILPVMPPAPAAPAPEAVPGAVLPPAPEGEPASVS